MMSSMAHQTRIEADQPRLAGPAMGAALIVALLGLVFFHFFKQQAQFAIKYPSDWGHTVVIPFIAGYFVYLQREKLAAQPFKTTWIGLVPVLLGILGYSATVFGPQTLNHNNLRGAGVAVTLFGLVLLFCGWQAMRYLWFPLAYLVVFGQTISERVMKLVTEDLQDIAAVGSHIGFTLVGMDVDRAGNALTLHHNGQQIPLNIAEACSGMRMLMAFLALGVAMAYTGLPHLWQRIALVLLALPTAIFVNVLRVMTLGFLSLIDPGLATGDFHSFIGLLWLVPAFMIYLGIMWILRHLVTEPDELLSATGGGA
jgi:exosortase